MRAYPEYGYPIMVTAYNYPEAIERIIQNSIPFTTALPAHIEFSDCPGCFMAKDENDNLICNECGITLGAAITQRIAELEQKVIDLHNKCTCVFKDLEICATNTCSAYFSDKILELEQELKAERAWREHYTECLNDLINFNHLQVAILTPAEALKIKKEASCEK